MKISKLMFVAIALAAISSGYGSENKEAIELNKTGLKYSNEITIVKH